MSRQDDAEKYRKQRADRAVAKTMGTFKVATTSPFTVYLDGAADPSPAVKLDGPTFSVDDTGIYWLRQGQLPVCGKTVA